jgi:hypothetical protein
MGKNQINIRGDLYGVAVNEKGASSEVNVGDRSGGAAVQAAIAELVRVADSDPELTPDQASKIRAHAKDLEAGTAKKPKRWNRDALREVLADITRLAATAGATTAAVEAVRAALAH